MDGAPSHVAHKCRNSNSRRPPPPVTSWGGAEGGSSACSPLINGLQSSKRTQCQSIAALGNGRIQLFRVEDTVHQVWCPVLRQRLKMVDLHKPQADGGGNWELVADS